MYESGTYSLGKVWAQEELKKKCFLYEESLYKFKEKSFLNT